jgi:cell division septation protein DedD
MLAAGTVSAALEGGPDPAIAARVAQDVAQAGPAREANAAIPVPAKAAPAAPPPAPSSAPPPAGDWQVQVGAFRSTVAAEAHLRSLEGDVPGLARLTRAHQLRGNINRVRIGGIEDEASARELCAQILAAGRGCFVAGPGD